MTGNDRIKKEEDVMPIIELLGALIMGGLVLAILKNLWKSHGNRVNTLHIS
jgi:hypothetical protein